MRVQEWLSRISKKVKWVFGGRNKFILRSIDMQGDAIIDLFRRVDEIKADVVFLQENMIGNHDATLVMVNARLNSLEGRTIGHQSLIDTLARAVPVSERRSKDYAKRLQGKTLEETAKLNKIWQTLEVEVYKHIGEIKTALETDDKRVRAVKEDFAKIFVKLDNKMDAYADKFEFIDGLEEKVKYDYDKFLSQLKKDVLEFKKTDQSIMRLTSLEERITIMEIHHRHREQLTNGSGQDSSRPIRTD